MEDTQHLNVIDNVLEGESITLTVRMKREQLKYWHIEFDMHTFEFLKQIETLWAQAETEEEDLILAAFKFKTLKAKRSTIHMFHPQDISGTSRFYFVQITPSFADHVSA